MFREFPLVAHPLRQDGMQAGPLVPDIDVMEIQLAIGAISERLDNIKPVKPIDVKKLKKSLNNDFGKYFKKNIIRRIYEKSYMGTSVRR